MESDAFTQLKYMAMRGYQWAKNMYGYMKKNPSEAWEYHKYLIDHRPASPEEGYQYRYDPWSDTWVLNKMNRPDDDFLYHESGRRWNKTPTYYRQFRAPLPEY